MPTARGSETTLEVTPSMLPADSSRGPRISSSEEALEKGAVLTGGIADEYGKHPQGSSIHCGAPGGLQESMSGCREDDEWHNGSDQSHTLALPRVRSHCMRPRLLFRGTQNETQIECAASHTFADF